MPLPSGLWFQETPFEGILNVMSPLPKTYVTR